MRFSLPFHQMFGGSSQLLTAAERAVIKSLSTVQAVLGSSRKLGGAAEHLIDGSEKRKCRWTFEFYSPHVIERRSNRLESFHLMRCVYSWWSFLFYTTHPKRNISFSVFRETSCTLAKRFYCYVFEMTTERIVSVFFHVIEYRWQWWFNCQSCHSDDFLCLTMAIAGLFSFQAKVVLYSIGK